MQISGVVHEVGGVQQVTDTFKKRDLVVVVAENPEYPEYIKVEATQDRTKIFDGLSTGDEVTVSINLRGRPWTDKEGNTTYFNSIVAWKVDKGSNQPERYEGGEEGGPESDTLPF